MSKLILAILVSISSAMPAVSDFDIETLLRESVDIATSMLEQSGKLEPFGITLMPNGEMIQLAIGDNVDTTSVQHVLNYIRESFQCTAKGEGYLATAAVYSQYIQAGYTGGSNESRSITIEVDHTQGYSARVAYVYEIVDGAVTVGEMILQETSGGIFEH